MENGRTRLDEGGILRRAGQRHDVVHHRVDIGIGWALAELWRPSGDETAGQLDGIVSPRSSCGRKGERDLAIPMRCTHLGFAAHPDVGGVLFTGSAQTGIAINRQFAANPGKILALEMGGNNPIVAWDTADIASAAALIVQSAFLSSGQRCTAASRLIVRESLADTLIGEVRKLADRLIVDHPHADPAPYMGPVIDNLAADQLTESFLYLMSNGGRPIKHMQRPTKGLPFVTPAIIDVTAMAERPDVELFGPLLQVIRVPDFESAIREANNTRYGLSAALVGGSPEQYNQFWANIRA